MSRKKSCCEQLEEASADVPFHHLCLGPAFKTSWKLHRTCSGSSDAFMPPWAYSVDLTYFLILTLSSYCELTERLLILHIDSKPSSLLGHCGLCPAGCEGVLCSWLTLLFRSASSYCLLWQIVQLGDRNKDTSLKTVPKKQSWGPIEVCSGFLQKLLSASWPWVQQGNLVEGVRALLDWAACVTSSFH